MNIGLSFGVMDEEFSIWSEGSIQSLFFLYYLLKKIEKYNVFIVNFGISISDLKLDIPDILNDIKFVEYDDIKNDIDIFIEIGTKLTLETTKELRDNGTKIVLFNTDNTAIKDIEDILFNNRKENIIFDEYDEIWVFQHHEKLNKYYLEELYKKPVYIVPMIWSDVFIKKYEDVLLKQNLNLKYEDNGVKKDITIFENNLDVVRTSIYPLLISERAYNKRPELFNKIRLLNTFKFNDNVKFLSFVNSLNIKKDGIATFENRYSTPFILSKYTDIVLTHQWENELTYLYFDVLYGNYPMIHNSNSINLDVYKYNDFNIELGSIKLIDSMINHKKNQKKYETYCTNVLNSYSINNEKNILIYENIIDNLYKK